MKDDATTPEKWGDCCLIVFPNGQTMLLDCGQVGMNSHIVENLKRMGIKKLDYLTITHRRGDHFGGAVTEGGVLDTFPVGQVYTSQIYNANLDNPMIIEEICTEKSIPLQYLYKGNQLTFGDVAMDVLWPENDLTDQHLTDRTSGYIHVISDGADITWETSK